jgi:NDP-sugar pyrophosphorylase family protein
VLAPVRGRPYLTYLLDQLAEVSVREVVLLTGYQADQVYRCLGEEYRGMRLVHSPEPSPLGTAGALRSAVARFSTATVLLMNGDSYGEVDLAAFRAFHRRRAADLSLVLAWAPDTARYGRVCLGDGGRVTRFGEKAEAGGGWINAGIYLVRRDLIGEVPAGRAVSLEREMLPGWASRGKGVYGFRGAARFIDIGTPESYAAAETFFQRPSLTC